MRVRNLANGGRGLETDRGEVGVWARSPILLIQLRGYGAGAFADLILAGFVAPDGGVTSQACNAPSQPITNGRLTPSMSVCPSTGSGGSK